MTKLPPSYETAFPSTKAFLVLIDTNLAVNRVTVGILSSNKLSGFHTGNAVNMGVIIGHAELLMGNLIYPH